jgi:DNA (cytosine-5)-methyltransferase 1
VSRGIVADLFAGGGGASAGIEAALGRPVDIAINHDPVALAVHAANHPTTRHLTADVWEVKPQEATGGRPVDLLWLSPDCKFFSRAKGAKPREEGVRSLAWVAIRWAAAVRPAVIVLENVPEFEEWGPLGEDGLPDRTRLGLTFRRWRGRLQGLGYRIEHAVLDSSLYGVPTRRRRLFLVARCDGQPIRWPAQTHGRGRLPLRTAAECIDWTLPCPSIFGRKKPLAEKTLRRVALGVQRYVLETPRPYIVDGAVSTLIQTGYGERAGQAPRVPGLDKPLGTIVAGGSKHALVAAWVVKHFGGVVGSPLTEPTSTITARDHHGLVQAEMFPSPVERPFRVPQVRAFLTAYYGNGSDSGQSVLEPMRTVTTKHRLGLVTVAGVEFQIVDIGLRMLRAHELLRAQFGKFAAGYDLSRAETETHQIRLIGNSVPPEVAEAIVRANLPGTAEEVAA